MNSRYRLQSSMASSSEPARMSPQPDTEQCMRAPPSRAAAGGSAVGGRVGLLVSGEEEVLLELGGRVEEELETIADEELALVLQLVAVLDVALLDAGALAKVALLTHGRPPPRSLP